MKSTTQDRVAVLRMLAADTSIVNDFGLLRAAANCLGEEEAAHLLHQEAGISSVLRDAVLKKVVTDASTAALPVHLDLSASLLAALLEVDARKRQGIAYCLNSMLPALPFNERRRIQSVFLEARFVGLRRRGYKSLAGESEPPIHALRVAWEKFKDPECAWLLVKLLPLNGLVSLKGELTPHLAEGWKISRMYLRLAEIEPSAPEELLATDGVSYCYVMAKLGRSIPVARAKSLLKRYATDERLGLLVWSLGKMQHWEVLIWLGKQLPEFQDQRLAAIMARHDT